MASESRLEYLNSPALAAPSGVTPNFDGPDSAFHFTFPLLLVSFAISNVMFGMKMYVQLRVVRKMRMEDYMLIIGWLVHAFAFTPVAIIICYLPVGVHQWNLKMGQMMRHLFFYNTVFIIYGISVMFIKVNILLQYARIFSPKGLRNFTFWASHVLIWLNVVFYLVWTFFSLFQCTPRAKAWDVTIPGKPCMSSAIVSAIGSSLALASDIIVLVLPQRVIWQLQIPFSKKAELSAIFTIGTFACASSGVRMRYVIDLVRDPSDSTFLLFKIWFWATTQLVAGFLVACLTATPVFVKHVKKQSWAVRLASATRRVLRNSQLKDQHQDQPQVPTPPSKAKPNFKAKIVSDIEFEELVRKTDNVSVRSASQVDIDVEPKGDMVV